ncbi:MAG TPA: right-handed parallel beta-helix repeat-containing protein, partial [Roseimicrobium sp.]|nr:right-handed parallel beta-helix repeat-containing protein [Roseimicrobium sp.]
RLGVQAGAWAFERSRTFTPGAAVRFIYALNTSVEGCTFRDLGDGAVSYEIGCHQGEISGCHFTRVGSNVIQIGRMPDYTGDKHPLHRDFARSEEWLTQVDVQPSAHAVWKRSVTILPEAPAGFKITDNTLLDCCHVDLGAVGIWVGYASHVRIEHNLLRGFPYTGISVGWRWGPGLTNCHSNTLAWNWVEGIMQEVGDGAGIYLTGEQPGTRVVNNFVRDSGRNYWSHGLYADECSDHMEISDNYVVQVMDHAIFMHKNGRNQTMERNNGEDGATVVFEKRGTGEAWVDFKPERTPPDLALYGPRASTQRGQR